MSARSHATASDALMEPAGLLTFDADRHAAGLAGLDDVRELHSVGNRADHLGGHERGDAIGDRQRGRVAHGEADAEAGHAEHDLLACSHRVRHRSGDGVGSRERSHPRRSAPRAR